MGDIMLRFIFQGLILFNPGPADPLPKDHLTAYLIDASSVPTTASGCVHQHMPSVAFRATPADCVHGGCQARDRDCSCNLARNEILISPAAVSAGISLSHSPATPLPTAQTEADFSYIINLARLGLSVDLTNLNSGAPLNLVGRLTIPIKSVTSCRLALGYETNGDYIHAYNFKRLGDNAAAPVTQAIAQALIAESSVPATSNVTIQLAGFNKQGIYPPIPLIPELCGDGTESCIEIWVSNMRDDIPINDPCNDGNGRDFAFFSKITGLNATWEASLVPQMDVSQRTQLSDAQACGAYVPGGHPTPLNSVLGPENLVSRPVCPMAVYYP
jgi:hypothetical protein